MKYNPPFKCRISSLAYPKQQGFVHCSCTFCSMKWQILKMVEICTQLRKETCVLEKNNLPQKKAMDVGLQVQLNNHSNSFEISNFQSCDLSCSQIKHQLAQSTSRAMFPVFDWHNTRWCLNHPIWKICPSIWIISPSRGERNKCLQPPPIGMFLESSHTEP